ncbi:MAG: trigger factor family protein, partial [Clostridia bacterium]|nr:trigger factor family protein [Clostridia bacterium]
MLKSAEKTGTNEYTLVVTVSAEDFNAAVNKVYHKQKNSINVPGFRKGKAPRAVVEGMYGKEVFYQDAMDELAPKAFEFGLNESGLKVVGRPGIKDIEVTDARTVVYTFSVSTYPEVTLGQYKGLSAVKDAVEVSDEEINKELEATR